MLEFRDELTARAESYARGARAANTWSAYERQWRRFESWCAAAEERALPADPLTVARFLADLAPVWRSATPSDPPSAVVAGQVCEREGLRPGTLSGYLAAISVVHQTAQLDNPTGAEAVRRTITGIRRHPGVAPTRRRAAARREPLVELLRLLRPEEVLADARDHALLLIGWKAALRTDDLARLQMADLHPSGQGLSVHLSRSKNDQHGTGTTIGIAAPSREDVLGEESEESTLLDAGVAWTRWRDLLGSHGILEGPAWRGIDRYGRRPRTGGLHRNSIAGIIKRRAKAARLEDADLWGGHSLRRGFATEAIAAGVPERDVQRHGRWRSRASMDPYVDAARTFDAANPTHWLT
ncbi:tyrosine-type recombinase/integrase [Actinomycetospora soli]|uniref:tyrosine-type recombinase/integrase n=1 Tax=Actinomycetospora soli TaxID=2893887 RepID=UPI001E31908D|nr:tyrosine-type recombinase/integrase [Actinomycetospora soli]MCD2191619.1 tyrosine-type recombinase/integrase [Actinomycetospora soli]